jgi:hypothetical protein
VEKGKNRNVLFRDNLHGWVDSAAIDSVKGAFIIFFVKFSDPISYGRLFDCAIHF